MIIGILQCDSIRPEYQDQFDNYPQMFQVLIKQVAPDIETIIYDVEHNEYPNDIQVCDAYITTGSKASVNEAHAWIKTLQEFVVKLYDNRKKLAAICFGHQLVAQALDGQTQKSAKGWGVGVHHIDIYTHKPWMIPNKDHINMLVSHQDQVVKLPKDAELLAGNSFCPNSMLLVDNCFLTMQGHPEFTTQYAETMMIHRRQSIGEEAFNTGLKSLSHATDEIVLAKWIVQFFNSD